MSLNTSQTAIGCDEHEEAKAAPSRLAALFNTIMTPIHLTTFVVSLFLIDWWYTVLRTYTHSYSPAVAAASSRLLPAWLHGLVYQGTPYAYDRAGKRRAGDGDGPWHYHSKQKSLMRMEAEEAFRLRKTVVVGMVVGAALTAGSIWSMSRNVYRYGLSFLI